MKRVFAVCLLIAFLFPASALAAVDVLARGWGAATIEELLLARAQIDIQIQALGGTLPNDTQFENPFAYYAESTPAPTPTPKPTATPTLIGLAKEAEENAQGQSLNQQLLEFQKLMNDTGASLRTTKDTKNYSYSEEEIWQYCMNRWDYYDRLAGGYAGDKYTSQVFKDAGKEFGISAAEAERIWDKVDRSKYGLD